MMMYSVQEELPHCIQEVIGGAGGNSYQWQQLSGAVWTNISGANGADYTTPVLSTGTYSYRLVVSQDTGCDGVSNTQVIVVNDDPVVSLVADDMEFCNGGSTTIHGTVTGGAGTNAYQWQTLVAGNWLDVASANSINYTTPILVTGTYTYRLLVTQDAGCSAASAGITLNVTPDPQVFISVNDDEICNGGTVTFDSEVVGGAGGNTYQWQQNISGNWVNISGANSPGYTTPVLATGSYSYRLVVTQNVGCESASQGITIGVNEDPLVFISADDQEFCDGGTTTLHSEVIGGAGGNNYQWQTLVAGNWVNIAQANSADYLTVALSTGTYTYRLVVTQDAGCESASSNLIITVNADPVATIIADDTEFCDGGFTIIHGTVTGGAGTNNYQWQQSSGSNWLNIAGANAINYNTGILVAGTYSYRLVVTQDAGCESASPGVTIQVNPDPQVLDSADDTDFCNGGFTILHSQVLGGAGASNYQWQQLLAGNWINLAGANNANYTTPVFVEGTYTYRVIVTQDSGCFGVSDGVIITVTGDPIVTANADDTEFCNGGSTTIHANVSGGAGTNNYQWQQLFGALWVNISGATGANYTTQVLSQGTYTYRVMVQQDAGCEGVSNGVTITVNDDPDVFVNADDVVFCQGGTTTLHANVVGGAGTNQYQWQQFVGGLWVNISGATGANYLTPPLNEGTYTYRVVVSQDAGCDGVSDGISITINDDPDVFINAIDTDICDGGSAVIESEVVGGAGGNNYQWQEFISGVWVNIPGRYTSRLYNSRT
jgi:hypothetical protein